MLPGFPNFKSSGPPPVIFLGSTDTRPSAGADANLSFSGWGLQEGDIVVVMSATAEEGTGQADGYTELAEVEADSRLFVWAGYKRMTSTPDTGVVVEGTGAAEAGLSVIAFAYRRINATTAVDVAVTTAIGVSTNPNPPAITPTTGNCCIIAFAGSNNLDASPGTIANYSTPISGTGSGSSFSVCLAACYRILSGGAGVAENPAAFSSWGSGDWAAVTIALRQAA
jgi:hypothetical protein